MAALGGRFLTMFCGITFTLFFFTLATFFQSLPMILRVIQNTLEGFLRLSIKAYRSIFERVLPTLIHHPVWRVLATTSLSIILYAGLATLMEREISGGWFAVSAIHGLVVGLNWERGFRSGDLHLGVDL